MHAGSLGNLLIVLVPAIASKSSLFTDDEGEQGLAYVFAALFAICIAAFTVVGALLERPPTIPSVGDSDNPEADPKLTESSPFAVDQVDVNPSPFHCVGEPAGSFSLRHSRELERRSMQLSRASSKYIPRLRNISDSPPKETKSTLREYDTTLRGSSRPDTLVSALFATHYYSQRLTLDGMSADSKAAAELTTVSSTQHAANSAAVAAATSPASAAERLIPNSHSNPAFENVSEDSFEGSTLPEASETMTVSTSSSRTPAGPYKLTSIAENPAFAISNSEPSSTDGSEAMYASHASKHSHPAAQLSTHLDDLKAETSKLEEQLNQPFPPEDTVVSIPTESPSKRFKHLNYISVWGHRKKRDTADSANSMHELHNTSEFSSSISTKSIAPNPLRRFGKILKGLLNMPTIAIFVGLFIACTPPIRTLFYGPEQDPDDTGERKKGTLEVVTSVLRYAAAYLSPSCFQCMSVRACSCAMLSRNNLMCKSQFICSV